jgi:hypothetical protein
VAGCLLACCWLPGGAAQVCLGLTVLLLLLLLLLLLVGVLRAGRCVVQHTRHQPRSTARHDVPRRAFDSGAVPDGR